jgi:hypothetical protein
VFTEKVLVLKKSYQLKNPQKPKLWLLLKSLTTEAISFLNNVMVLGVPTHLEMEVERPSVRRVV